MKDQIKTTDDPFFKLPFDQDLILLLIKKELQGTKLITELAKVGFDSGSFYFDLRVIILSLLGFKNQPDELWGWYYDTMVLLLEKVDLRDESTVDELTT